MRFETGARSAPVSKTVIPRSFIKEPRFFSAPMVALWETYRSFGVHKKNGRTMTPDKLKRLETLLNESEDFNEIFSFYMDHFADHRLFIEKSKKAKVPFLKEILRQAAAAFFRKIPVSIIGFAALDNERLSILHGGGFVEGHLFNCFYCKRINKGMFVISTPGSTEMFRITPTPLGETKLTDDFMESVDQFTVRYNHKNPN
jgi:hypothetical protein